MTDFATDLLWEDEKQPALPMPVRPGDRQHDSKKKEPAPVAPAESQAERLQRIAGNAVLAREAEEAEAAKKRIAEAARRPARAPTKKRESEKQEPAKRERAKPEKKRRAETDTKAMVDPRAPSTAKEKIVKKRVAEAAATVEVLRLSETQKAATACAAALAQVFASFEKDAGKADLLTLALLLEQAPPGIAEETARALARAVMRADPAQRAAIAMRIKTQLGDRRDLRLSRLLADRLAGLATVPTRPAPPRPPPPAPPP